MESPHHYTIFVWECNNRYFTIWNITILDISSLLFWMASIISFSPYQGSTLFRLYSTITMGILCFLYTLFSECFAHENHPNFLKSLGHRPRPRGILILSNCLESNLHTAPKIIWQIWHDPGSGLVTQGHRENWAKSMCTSFGEECSFSLSYSDKKFLSSNIYACLLGCNLFALYFKIGPCPLFCVEGNIIIYISNLPYIYVCWNGKTFEHST